MKIPQQTKGKASIKFLANALTTILVSYSLLLKGIRMWQEMKARDISDDPVLAALRTIEPDFYISSAGLLMYTTFGKEGTEIRDIADKCVVDMVRAQLKMDVQKT